MKRVKNRRILLIISSFFPNSNVGRGPWSERFNGLYLKLIKKPMALAGVYWYSMRGEHFISQKEIIIVSEECFFLSFLFQTLIDVFKYNNKIIFLIAYPCFRSREVVVSELFFRICTVLRRLGYAEIIVDFIDPPIFMAKMQARHKFIEKIIFYFKKREEKDYLLCSDTIITNADAMADFLREEYNLDSNRFTSIPMGINVADFSPDPERFHRKQFTILYGGTISDDRGILRLIECIERINKKVVVNLTLCGKIIKPIKLPKFPWMKVFPNLTYKQYRNIIMKYADIGIIPYPVNKCWRLVSISKLTTYLAAGIPVLSTNLLETAQFIKQWNCGFLASSW